MVDSQILFNHFYRDYTAPHPTFFLSDLISRYCHIGYIVTKQLPWWFLNITSSKVVARMIYCHHALFSIPDNVAFFNCSGLAPILNSSRDAGLVSATRKAQPWCVGRTERIDEPDYLRTLFAGLIGPMRKILPWSLWQSRAWTNKFMGGQWNQFKSTEASCKT